MSEIATRNPLGISKPGIWWLAGCAVIFALGILLGWIDNATELTPDHSDFIELSFVLGMLAAVASIFVMWRATPYWPIAGRVGFTLACALFSFLSLSIALMPVADIFEGWIDFPPSKTVTYKNSLLKISRAYQTHGKGRSWNIQTMPIWSNLDITQDDYDGMLHHRSPDDHGSDPDEIDGRGYFCAQVTLQRAGDAIRVLHAGKGKLPHGSVIVCPADVERVTPT